MTKRENDLREILRLTRELVQERLGHQPAFEPGETTIGYSGRVYDEEEVVRAVDASLDFWLTLGHTGVQSERAIADFVGMKHGVYVNSGLQPT